MAHPAIQYTSFISFHCTICQKQQQAKHSIKPSTPQREEIMVYQKTYLFFFMWFAITFVLQAIKGDCQNSKSQILDNDYEINHLSNFHGHLWPMYRQSLFNINPLFTHFSDKQFNKFCSDLDQCCFYLQLVESKMARKLCMSTAYYGKECSIMEMNQQGAQIL